MGLGGRWYEVAKTYAEVNDMLGDIIKVTPSYKMVGDLALTIASDGISRTDVENSDKEISFPGSV